MNNNRYTSMGKKIRSWEVDKILDKKLVGGKSRYLVKWRRTFSELNTWELRESFSDSTLIDKFEAEIQRARQSIVVHRSADNVSRRSTPVLTETRTKSIGAKKTKTSVADGCCVTEETCLDGEKIKLIRDLMENELQCCICHGIFENPRLTECEHIFCDKCIEQWKTVNRTCPICRTVLARSEKKLIRIDNFITKATRVLKE